MGRVAVFIDGGYLDKTLELEFERRRIDYEKFARDVAGSGEMFRVYYYYAMPFQSDPPTEEEKTRYRNKQRFVDSLARLSLFDMRKGRLQKIGGAFKQKRVDCLLTADLVRLAWLNRIDTAVIVGGDDDFVPAVEEAKMAGVFVRLYYSSESCSNELRQVCDECLPIDEALVSRNELGR
jgi:uncharacterized LabA/DUF88 family protein